MSSLIKTQRELYELGIISQDDVSKLEPVVAQYALSISQTMIDLIDRDNPHDPIARQFIPNLEELNQTNGESTDPIGDEAHSPVYGIVHRYPDRVLLTLNFICPVYCRFCFRRDRVGPKKNAVLTEAQIDNAIRYIADNDKIWEVIITGGDPLMLSPRQIHRTMKKLSEINHISVVRIHSRVPIVKPDLVCHSLISAILSCEKTVYVGIHCNHPREITDDARTALSLMRTSGMSLVSQTVLLRGVNDNLDVLVNLMRCFVELQIRPYYLHHGDHAPGTAHLLVPLEEGRKLVQALRGHVSGLCQPTYILDIPGGFGKVPVGPNYVEDNIITDPWGDKHAYEG